jgi:hypothetical protein
MILKFYHDFTNLQFGRQKIKINYYFMGKNLVGKIQCLFDTFFTFNIGTRLGNLHNWSYDTDGPKCDKL